jgi:hypothetical protein
MAACLTNKFRHSARHRAKMYVMPQIIRIEIMHIVHKGQIAEIHDVISEVQLISNLMADAA